MTRTQTAKQAVKTAKEAGEEIKTVKDEKGNEFEQRPIDINDVPEPVIEEGARVLVFNPRNTTLHLTDCKVGPMAEAQILATDYEKFGEKLQLKKLA